MAPCSHDPDTSADLAHRQWLQDILALAAAGLTGSQVLRAVTQGPIESLNTFVALSQALMTRPALDRGVGTRLLVALGKSSADSTAQLRPLVQALAADSFSDAQQKATLQILEAQYLGVVGDNAVTYEQTLMYSVVSDTLAMRTYYLNQPDFQAEPPVERQA